MKNLTIILAIILGIFYKRMNKEGAVSGMIVGMLLMLYYMLKFKFGIFDGGKEMVDALKPDWWFGISPEGFGTIAMLANFIVAIVVCKFTPPPPKEVQDIVELILTKLLLRCQVCLHCQL